MIPDQDVTHISTDVQHPGLSPGDKPAVKTPGAVVLEARHLSAHASAGSGRDEDGFRDISLYIGPAQLVAITGPNPAATSALLAALAGIRPAGEGKVQIDGVSLTDFAKAFAPRIGYVPRRPAIYPGLTVADILLDAAALRLPRSTTAQQRRERVEEVMAALDLHDVRRQPMRAITSAQRWRVQIALELVARPSLLFIDEPEESPGAGAQVALMRALRSLAAHSLTVLMATGSPAAMALADRVVLLSPQGRLAWFGPPDEALAHFQALVDRPSGAASRFGFDDILALLAENESGTPQDWSARFLAHPAYRKYVAGPLDSRHPDLLQESNPLARVRGRNNEPQPPPAVPQVGWARQFVVLAARGLKQLLRDRQTLALAFAAPLGVAGLTFLLTSPRMYDPVAGNATQVTVTTALLAFVAVLVAALSSSSHITRETAVRRRERQIGLRSLPYILAKVVLVVLIALYQGLVWAGIYFAVAEVPAGMTAMPSALITLVIGSFLGGMIGLVASALSGTLQIATLWVLLLVLPQAIFSGGIVPLQAIGPAGQVLAALTPAHHTFNALIAASGVDRDLAAGGCWQAPADRRQSLPEKQKLLCPCMGANVLTRCSFPGVRRLASPLLDTPQPMPLVADSILSAVPVQPAPRSGETLADYAREVDSYTLALEVYHNGFSAYIDKLRQYAIDSSQWQRQYGLAVGAAEGTLAAYVDAYGLIDSTSLAGIWLSQLGAALALMAVLLIVVARKARE